MHTNWKLGMVPVLLAGCVAATAAETNLVTYEAFGAVGDGVADDLAAICAAHAHANRHGLPVRSNPKATYQLGRTARTAVIAYGALTAPDPLRCPRPTGKTPPRWTAPGQARPG